MKQPTIERRSAITDGNSRLTALQIRGEELRRTISDLDRTELIVRKDLDRAQREHDREAARGFYDVPTLTVERLRDAQRRLDDLLTRRDAAKSELDGLQARKVGVIREVAPDVWSEYVDARQAAVEIGIDIVNKIEPLVEKYTTAAERLEGAKAGLDRLFSPLGPHAERVLSELRRQLPDVEPDDPEDLEALHKASRMRQLFWRNPLA